MTLDLSEYAVVDRMGDYTPTLGNLIAWGLDTDDKLGLADYPLYDESHRDALNRKIVRHYLLREIGAETEDMFVFYLRRTMFEQMDYLNQLYESAALKFDPFVTTDMTGESESNSKSSSSGKSSGSQSSSTNTSGSNRTTADNSSMTFNSEFPQTRIDDFRKFATSASQTDSKGTTDSESTQSSVSKADSQSTTDFQHSDESGSGVTRTHGFSGSKAQLLADWRRTMLNIDMMVVEGLEPCFMQLLGSGDMLTSGPVWPNTSLMWALGR